MTEQTMKSPFSSQSFSSATSNMTAVSSPTSRRSEKSKKELSKETVKSYPLSLPTRKRKEITKKAITKKGITKETKPLKSILKKTTPAISKTSSPRTSARKEKGTLNKFTRTIRSRTSSPKRSGGKGSQRKRHWLERTKSQLSVISKVSFRSTKQRNLDHDANFRNYLLGASPNSQMSLFSSKSQISTKSQGRKKSQKKFTNSWSSEIFHLRREEPKKPELLLLKTEIKEEASPGKESKESLISTDTDRSDPIIFLESEEESLIFEPEPEPEPEEEVKDEPAERNIFLQTFGLLPDIKELSSTETLNKVKLTNTEDDWHYVPPVDQDPSESETSGTDISLLEELESLTVVKTKSQTDISLNNQIESDDESLASLLKEPQVEDISVLMKKALEPKKVSVVTVDKPASIFKFPSIDRIEAFLDDLLELAAKLSYKPHMCRILDIEKLTKELTQVTEEYKFAWQQNEIFEYAICEHFIKRKAFQFVDSDREIDRLYIPRFKKAINLLDFNLEKEKKTISWSNKLLKKLKDEEKTAKSSEYEKIEKFEAKVREKLLKDGHNRLSFVINDLFREMNEVRSELSKSRLKLSSVQHQLATMKIQSENMDNQGISVNEYLTNQAIAQTLSEKIQERNADLSRLNDRVNHDLHIMAHLKEKERLSQDQLQDMQKKLNMKKQKLKQLREVLYVEMLRRKRVMKEIENIRRGNLLHYPEILRDYDATEEHLKAKRKVIKKLRSEHNRLERKLLQVDADIADVSRAEKIV